MSRTPDHTIPTPQITLRAAGDADSVALLRLAALDSAEIPSGPLVVAQQEGELVAAVAVDDGTAIADPFRRTAATVALLQLHARELRGTRDRRPQPFLRRLPRAAPRAS